MTVDKSCIVHWASVRRPSPRDLSLLSNLEQDRARRYRHRSDHDRFVSGVVLARRTVGELVGIEPAGLEVDRRCRRCGADHGKPELPGLHLQFSVTHAGDVVGVAVSDAGPVGLDVEAEDARSLLDLAPSVLGVGEHVSSTVEVRRYWVRKEAVVKATGDGIGVGLTGVVVSHPSASPALLDYPGPTEPQVQLADLQCRAAYVASVAVVTPYPVRIAEVTHLRA